MTELEQEFLKLYEEQADSVFRLCYFKTSSKETAEDLVQDTFTKTWGYIAKGKEIDNLRAFMFTVARNLIKDYYKKKKSLAFSDVSELQAEDISNYTGTEAIVSSSELALVLDKFKILSQADQELLQFRIIEGLPVEEIAVILNERPNTVSVRIHRALKRFREQFKDLENKLADTETS